LVSLTTINEELQVAFQRSSTHRLGAAPGRLSAGAGE
jgi:hypothetical protein